MCEDNKELGASPTASDRATPEQSPQAVSALRGGIADAAWLLLSDFYDASERGVFATACDGRRERKLAWQLDERGLARWCGTNWGSHFFAITNEGKALIDREVAELSQRLAAQAMSTGTAKTPKAVEGRSPASAVSEADAPTPLGEISNHD